MNFLAFFGPIASTTFWHVAAMRIVISGIVLVILTPAAIAQQPAAKPEPDTEVTKQLLKRVEELEARLKDLEAKQANVAPSASPAPTGTTADAAEEAADHSHEAGTMQGMPGIPIETPTMQIKGFADVSYQASDQKRDKNAFVVGQVDLFITSHLSETLSMAAEVVIEAGEDNRIGVDLERLLLQYNPNDRLNLSVGRYHTAIGFYNTAYHHGEWFQTTVDRPFIFAFEDEGGVLPIHNVGVSATGRIPSGKLGLRFIAEIGNGRTSRSPFDESVQNVVDENNGKAVNLGLIARPDWLPGLQAGFSVYRDQLHPEGLPKMGQTIMAGHLVYIGRKYEMLNEALVVRHTQRDTGRIFNTTGFYTQVARKFGKYQPYLRYQYINAPADEPIFGDVGRRNGPSLGVRYELSEFLDFKAQYDRTFRRSLSAGNKVKFQLAFTF